MLQASSDRPNVNEVQIDEAIDEEMDSQNLLQKLFVPQIQNSKSQTWKGILDCYQYLLFSLTWTCRLEVN